MKQQDFFSFCQNFVRYKLAEHFSFPPQEITLLPLRNGSNTFRLEMQNKHFIIKFSSSVFTAKDKRFPMYDFDIRQNIWVDGGNKKIPMEQDANTYYVLVALENNVPHKIFLISSEEIPTSHVRIAIKHKSKYHKYEI